MVEAIQRFIGGEGKTLNCGSNNGIRSEFTERGSKSAVINSFTNAFRVKKPK